MRKRIAKWTLIIIITLMLFVWTKRLAFAERGYDTDGGEYLILMAPLFCYIIKRTVRDIVVSITELLSGEER